jgi:hypothetical protein
MSTIIKQATYSITLCILFFFGSASGQTPVYDRGDWRHWVDHDHDGQDTRQEVLIEESRIPVVMNRNASRVLSGEWLDIYTGQYITDPSDLDIDHTLALAWVHERGGFAWDAATREAFANDLTDPDHLMAVSASVNRSKGARGPDSWHPPDTRSWCWYGATVVRISFTWGLVLTAADRAGLADLLAMCEVEEN